MIRFLTLRQHPHLAICFLLCGLLTSPAAFAQSKPIVPAPGTTPAISLDRASASDPLAERLAANGKPLPTPPANFRRFSDANAGELGPLEPLTLRFAQTTKLTGIASTPDFRVEQGSSCVEGNVYEKGTTCSLLVRFTPQGPGNRVGKLTISHSASPTPFYVGLGGEGYAPAISFIPSQIATVASSYPSSKGLLNGAQNLFVDGGDTLYVADTGNNVIRSMDASGNFTTISTGTLNAPVGIAADSFGEVFFDEPTSGLLFEIFAYGYQDQLNGSGYPTCSVASPCKMNSTSLNSPGQMAIDSSNQLFFANDAGGAAVSEVNPFPPTYAPLTDPFTFISAQSGAFTIDEYDNLYSAYLYSNTYGNSVCSIVSQTYSNAVGGSEVAQKIAGGKTCGFAGDGGQARNAEISGTIGQLAFDIAGNLYFTDAGNQRVRRIDNSTGVINTIAGNGYSGYSGDGGVATSADLANPTGVAVDSQGQVYVVSATATGASTQVIRRIGPNGQVSFSSQLVGVTSAPKTIIVSNIGNAAMTLTHAYITGTNASDFTMDPQTTTCNVADGATLASGQSCKIGFIFKPTAAGGRGASMVLLTNTVAGTNIISLYGPATLPNATVAITSPAAGSSFTSGTTVPFKVSVTASTTPAPTGTVTFSVDGAAFGSPVTIASGAASINLTGLTTKTHTISALYNGDTHFAATGPVSESITVTAAAVKSASAVKLTAPATQAVSCSTVAFSVAVTGSGTPTGIVQLKDGGIVLASATLQHGAAIVGTTSLTPGTHMISANYAGDATHLPAFSPAVKQVVTGLNTCNLPSANPVRGLNRELLR